MSFVEGFIAGMLVWIWWEILSFHRTYKGNMNNETSQSKSKAKKK